MLDDAVLTALVAGDPVAWRSLANRELRTGVVLGNFPDREVVLARVVLADVTLEVTVTYPQVVATGSVVLTDPLPLD
jgi:hypothetical protein